MSDDEDEDDGDDDDDGHEEQSSGQPMSHDEPPADESGRWCESNVKKKRGPAE